MNPDESFPEIPELLRSDKPECLSSPGLELRILRALDQTPAAPEKPWWRWFLLPPALAAIGVLLWPLDPPAAPPSAKSPALALPRMPALPVDFPDVFAANPLSKETATLAKDAGRAGDFLVSALPSFGGFE